MSENRQDGCACNITLEALIEQAREYTHKNPPTEAERDEHAISWVLGNLNCSTRHQTTRDVVEREYFKLKAERKAERDAEKLQPAPRCSKCEHTAHEGKICDGYFTAFTGEEPCPCDGKPRKPEPAPLSPERPASLKNIEEWLPYADSVRITKLIQYALKLERERLSMERRREWADRLEGFARGCDRKNWPDEAEELRAIAKELRDAGPI